MYKCKNCGRTFDEPRLQYEDQGYYGSAPAFERWTVCPYCGEAGYEEYHEYWYAVQESPEDAWDYGDYDYEVALKMLKEQGRGLIAVINEETRCCEEEIRYDEVIE